MYSISSSRFLKHENKDNIDVCEVQNTEREYKYALYKCIDCKEREDKERKGKGKPSQLVYDLFNLIKN